MAGDYRHWKLETDGDNLVWLSLDKAGSSTNVLSADVMSELDRIVDEMAAQKPRGLIVRSAKESGFIAG
ncbi:MAG TPA: enoyl-CoA hydratase, partial [Burkholderiales bacterium]|nr:enoyl-CoA hydratase [Burkholderiales bacterium]